MNGEVSMVLAGLGKLGGACALTFGAMGSCLGVVAAGLASVGAWKKCYQQNKAAPFLLVAFIGAPLSQTIYGFILQNAIVEKAAAGDKYLALLGEGLLGGIAIGMSAWFQGRIGASAAESLAETGKGFGNYLMALGVIETVALFVMVFIRAAL